MKVKVDENKCVGCRLCELTCSIYKDEVFNPESSNIRVIFEDDGKINIETEKGCKCSQAPCVDFCPTNAINRIKKIR